MGFQGHYRKLKKDGEQRRPRWLIRKGKTILFRLSSPSKRFKWVRFSIVVIPKRVSEFYAELFSTILRVDAAFPTINFSSSQWGLPALLHPSVVSKKRQVVSQNRDKKMYAC